MNNNMDNKKLSSNEMLETYDAAWYDNQARESYKSAKATLFSISNLVPNLNDNVKSVIDVGCGVGTWLKAWQELYENASICGIDGNDVAEEHFFIPYKYYQKMDLTRDSNELVNEIKTHCNNANITLDTLATLDTMGGGGGQTL